MCLLLKFFSLFWTYIIRSTQRWSRNTNWHLLFLFHGTRGLHFYTNLELSVIISSKLPQRSPSGTAAICRAHHQLHWLCSLFMILPFSPPCSHSLIWIVSTLESSFLTCIWLFAVTFSKYCFSQLLAMEMLFPGLHFSLHCAGVPVVYCFLRSQDTWRRFWLLVLERVNPGPVWPKARIDIFKWHCNTERKQNNVGNDRLVQQFMVNMRTSC